MGRAIVREPRVFLMDEPLSNLDAKLRTQMRAEIGLLHKELGVTTIYVTHDQIEAMTLGQRVAVMRKGELQQAAPPQELYDRPANLFVAGFIGSPAMNFVEGMLESADRSLTVSFGSERLAIDEREIARHGRLAQLVGKRVIVGMRPEHLEDASISSGAPADRRLRGVVRLKEALGSETIVHFQVEAAPALVPELRELAEDVDEASFMLDESEQHRAIRRTAFVGRFSSAARIEEDAPAEIVVAPGALSFFDAETSDAIVA
jgi:multiple sugar transport system ATP-binding protein